MIIHFIDKVDIRTNGKFVPSISCTKKNAAGNMTIPLILTTKGVLSDPIDCKQEMALQRVKIHTTQISLSGTDANFDITFRVKGKVGNNHEYEFVRCEKLRLNNRCSTTNCHEYGDIDNYYVSDLGKYLTLKEAREGSNTLQMFCLLNSQMNTCKPNPKTTSSDFNR